MKQKRFAIGHIPALCWGEQTGGLLLAVHGSQSHKADSAIALLAAQAEQKGMQVLSFDLPGHGARKREPTPCKAQICTEELRMVMQYAREQTEQIRLFGCSLGAYFGLLAFSDLPLQQALFLSPVVDLARVTRKMMGWFSISEQQLQAAGEIDTPSGETLYWDDYQYITTQKITRWDSPTRILYGSADHLCERDVVQDFARRFDCRLTVQDGGEHFFHTPAQLDSYARWLAGAL